MGAVSGISLAKLPAIKNFEFFCKNYLILGLFWWKLMLFKCGIKISSAKIWSNWFNKWALLCRRWLMVKFRFSYLQTGTVNHSSKKRTRSNSFRIYLIKKNIWRGRLIEQYLRVEVIKNQLILNRQLATLPIPELIYLFMKPIFSMFQHAIKFDFLVWEIFQSFYRFVRQFFVNLRPPLNKCVNRCFESFLVQFTVITFPMILNIFFSLL